MASNSFKSLSCVREFSLLLDRTHRLVLRPLLPTLLTLLFISTAYAGEATVVDGDTLVLDGTTYRLHGIDSLEPGQKCNGAKKPWSCGKRATDRLVELTAGREVQCDNRGADDYDRILAVCHAGDIELNETMVREGYA